jgi:hypothetical protein
VTALVVRGALPLLRREHDPPLGAEHHLLEGLGEVVLLHPVVVVPGGDDRRLVDEVREVGAHHAGRRCGDPAGIDVIGDRNAAEVHPQDRLAPVAVGWAHHDPPVEAPRAQEGGVEDLGPVRGGQHDDALGAGEAIHLGEDLVEGLLALVVAADRRRPSPRPPDGVQLVDEDDRRGGGLGLLEQVAHAARPDPDDELDELRGRQ